ncbi:hypothetical protein LJC53_02885, partial [Bacteroidales bacterium OttesenSCG-928-C03]|nr:hypothetical protein [Bacteroidales bacterium OttesenSCG-928-C03]
TKKIQMQHKTANGFDVVHPETELSQITDIISIISRQKTINDNLVPLTSILLDHEGSSWKTTFGSFATEVAKYNRGYMGSIESVGDLPDPTIPGDISELIENCFLYVRETESFWYYDPLQTPKEWRNTDSTDGGINIIVSETEPEGMMAGDFWYKELV